MDERSELSLDGNLQNAQDDNAAQEAAELFEFIVEQEALRAQCGFYCFRLPTEDDIPPVMMCRDAKSAVIFPPEIGERIIEARHRMRVPPALAVWFLVLWAIGIFIYVFSVDRPERLWLLFVGWGAIVLIVKSVPALTFEPFYRREQRRHGISVPFPAELGSILIERRSRGLTAHQQRYRKEMLSITAGGAAELAAGLPLTLLGLGPIAGLAGKIAGHVASTSVAGSGMPAQSNDTSKKPDDTIEYG